MCAASVRPCYHDNEALVAGTLQSTVPVTIPTPLYCDDNLLIIETLSPVMDTQVFWAEPERS